jgi:hypothetical protein
MRIARNLWWPFLLVTALVELGGSALVRGGVAPLPQ